ncbi:MAG TPA: SDR family NAD(P)-dependent oxidoreductase, partial [Pseudomonadales bacterium]|nr:SDR family NAD(P)-dependent oxidoreductase [Pseudomonadales bacterium]
MLVLKDKKIWLTGASSGIGLALLHKLLDSGNTVFASSRSVESLNPLKSKYPERLHLVACDVTDAWSIAAATTHIS